MQAALSCLLEVASALEHMHSQGVVHGDLKSANVMLKQQQGDPRGFTCKVADFGLSRFMDSTAAAYTQNIGTAAYAAPEMLEKGRVTPAADIYSWSMVAWEVATGQLPHAGQGIGQIYFSTVIQKARPPIPDSVPPQLRALIEACWIHDPLQRPDASELVQRLTNLLAS